MTSAASSAQPAERVAFSRLLWVGPLTIVAAVIVNLLIRTIAVAVLQPDPQFPPFMPPITATFTVIGVLGAVIAYAIIGRAARSPIRLFRRVALIALLVSLIPDVLVAITGSPPGATVANAIVLMLMHTAAWAISVGMLTRLARA